MEKNKKKKFFWICSAMLFLLMVALVIIRPFNVIYYYQKITGKIRSSYVIGNINVFVQDAEIKINLLRYREIYNGSVFDQLSWLSKDSNATPFPTLDIFVKNMNEKNGIEFLNRPANLSLFSKNRDNFVREKRIININCFDGVANIFNNKFDMIDNVVDRYNEKPLFCIAKYGENEVSFVRSQDFYEITFIKEDLTVLTKNPSLIKHFEFNQIHRSNTSQ